MTPQLHRPQRKGITVAVAAFVSTLIGIGFVSLIAGLFDNHVMPTAALEVADKTCAQRAGASAHDACPRSRSSFSNRAATLV